MEQATKDKEELEIVKGMLAEYELIVDSWEQPRERPEGAHLAVVGGVNLPDRDMGKKRIKAMINPIKS